MILLRYSICLCGLLFIIILIVSHQSLPQAVGGPSSIGDALTFRQRSTSTRITTSSSELSSSISLWRQRLLNFIAGNNHQDVPNHSLLHHSSTKQENNHQQQQHRIAIVLPFIGKTAASIPPYLGLFCSAAAGAATLVDFLIFHPGVLETYATRGVASQLCPPNVHFINLGSMEALASKYLLRLMDHVPPEEWQMIDSRDMMVRILTKHLLAYPYALVEYKPTFGHVFAEYLVEYSHWGYSDLDIVFGDLSRWITADELNDYDIVTYGYGDQNRVYLRGQFTFHRNTPMVNAIWKKCEYLSRLDQRFGRVLAGEEKLKFESAEGCYSAAVLDRQDIRVKYATKAFTDTQDSDTVYSHGLYIAQQKRTVNHVRNFFRNTVSSVGYYDGGVKNVVIYKAKSKDEGKELLQSSHNWFERDSIYKDIKQPLQWEVGDKEVIELNDPNGKANCMYWAQKKYQSRLCISSDVTENDTVFWIHGKLYKQRFENARLDTNVDTAPFFHFQEWKRFYREGQLAAFRPDSDFSTFVLTKEGAIPVHYSHIENKQTSLARFSSDIKSPLGKSVFHWKAGNVELDRKLLPVSSYCLISAPRKFPAQPPAPQCSLQTSWWDEDQVHILSIAPAWQTDLDPKLDVTLVLTQQIPIYQSADPAALNRMLDLTITNLNRWQGQACVLIFHLAVDDQGHQDDVLALMESRFGVTLGSAGGVTVDADAESNKNSKGITTPLYGVDNCLVALIFSDLSSYSDKGKRQELPPSYHVSRKALLNMAIDAVPTRWFLSGIELERGMILSKDTAFFAHRVATAHQSIPGNIFWVPQFALGVSKEDFGEELTLNNMLEFHGKGDIIKKPIEFEKGFCEGEDGHDAKDDRKRIFDDITKVWWEMTETIVADDANSYVEDEALTERRANVQDELQLRLQELLADEKHYDLFAMDESPILLTDNQGPHNGILTNQIAREVEELGGKLCYNVLRMAQLATLGYSVNVLPGAFAVSLDSSRADAYRNSVHAGGLGDEDDSILGGSRCDGCFMFDEEHESILEDIAKDERKRPAKTAVLWEEPEVEI